MVFLQKMLDFYRDREYFASLVRIALPIATQSLVMSSLNMVSVVMIGQLGETELAAVGLAGQIFFLVNLILFGIGSGAAMFTAQLWGKGDVPNIRRVLGLSLKLGLVGSGIFWALAIFAPQAALRFYTEDAAVVALGADFLRIFGWSYPFFAVTFAYAFVLRSTGNVRLPMAVTIFALSLNTFLAYGLIFGNFGMPKMGVAGAAWAGLIARVLECLLMLVMVYRKRENPAAASLRDVFEFDPKFAAAVMVPVLPVIANEFLWSMGITTYNAIYARVGTEAIAAINIVGAIDQLAFVAFIGLGNATAILVGNLIGKGDKDEAIRYAGRSLGLQILAGILVGLLVILFADGIFNLYNVSPNVIESARALLLIMAAAIWLRAANMVIIVGILRAGGDTRFSLALDGLVIWIVGVPLAALAAFVLHWPVELVYLMALTEEITKFVFGLWRFFSRKWINNLAQAIT
ncbi:MAG: MATE family efflux transporter [Chloroflexi bacterium HGW-Chloroflexi-6]|nr:MAG: MATE family efflux transporter [Chloroflexi bacterium HGW-Chloroflexi-6]